MPTRYPFAVDQVFELGLTISLEFEQEGRPQFALSRVEELADDRLWVAMPTKAGTYLPLPVATPVVAYVKHDDAVYLLHCTVAGRRLQPSPMLELMPSGPIQRRPPREYIRLRIVLVPTSLMLLGPDGQSSRLAATILNLSAGGLMLRTRHPLVPDQQLQMVVELPEGGGVLDTGIKVLRVEVRRAERGHYYEAGCCFLDLSDEDRDLITAFIFRAQSRPSRADSPNPA